MKGSNATAYRSLPSVDALLRSETGVRVSKAAGSERTTVLARAVVEKLRNEIPNLGDVAPDQLLSLAQELLESDWKRSESNKQRWVINATGVIIHTNLGRAPLSKAAANAVFESAAGYCNIEYDLATGKRGKRGIRCEQLVCQLTNAESALIVNNCAAAAFLVLSTLASGGDVVISRGELVEIGGDFRVPDVLALSGARLREVGTTNRTKLSDYEKAVNENTRLILRVHPSNYRVVGFTSSPELSELAELAHRKGLFLYEDAGSGALIDLGQFGIKDEPVISRSIEAGADAVTFSGDKLLGGPQCGIIAGGHDLIEQLRKHPLYRALRVDKLIYAALQATLESYAKQNAESEIPTQRMLRTPSGEIKERAEKFTEKLRNDLPGPIRISVVPGESAVGGGAAPIAKLATWVITIGSDGMSAEKSAEILRHAATPVIARVAEEKLLIDLRTVFEEEVPLLLAALKEALAVSV